jgi:dolichol-phosphate mannosyltransferase
MIKKFLVYGVWWWFAAIIDLSSLWFFTEIVGIFYLRSAVIAFFLSLIFWYLFHKYITFDSAQTKHAGDMWRFCSFQVIGLGINIWLLWIFSSVFGYNYMLVAFFNKIVVFCWNFSMNYYFNFTAKWKHSQ